MMEFEKKELKFLGKKFVPNSLNGRGYSSLSTQNGTLMNATKTPKPFEFTFETLGVCKFCKNRKPKQFYNYNFIILVFLSLILILHSPGGRMYH